MGLSGKVGMVGSFQWVQPLVGAVTGLSPMPFHQASSSGLGADEGSGGVADLEVEVGALGVAGGAGEHDQLTGGQPRCRLQR